MKALRDLILSISADFVVAIRCKNCFNYFLGRLLPLIFLMSLPTFCATATSSSQERLGVIQDVALSRAFFDPRLRQNVAVSVRFGAAGRLTVDVLDRDGFRIRRIVRGVAVEPGAHTESWDGRNDDGNIVPSEAYCFRIQLVTASGVLEVYDPLTNFNPTVVDGGTPKYSRATGSLTYSLKSSARVYLQVGLGHREGKDQKLTGVVLANIVDHEPRPAGSIVETWSGYVPNTDFYLPNDPRLFIGVFAISLPENSVIVSSGGSERFADYARRHRPKDQVQPRTLAEHSHRYHAGLNAVEDRSPAVTILPLNATRMPSGMNWAVQGDLRVKASMDKEQARFFLTPQTQLQLFVDDKRISYFAGASNPYEATVPMSDLPAGEHLVTVNWISGLGPAGVATVKVAVPTKGKEAHNEIH